MGKKNKYDLNNMSVQEILDKTNAMFNSKDILNFCNDQDLIEAFIILNQSDFSKLEKLLVNNEEKIDKEKLVYNVYLNYTENRKLIEEKLEQLSHRIVNDFNSDSKISKMIGGKIKIKSVEDFMRILKEKREILTIALKMTNDKRLLHVIGEELHEFSKLDEEKKIEDIYLKNCRSLLKDKDVYIEKTRLDDNGHIEMIIHSSKEEIDGSPISSKREVERLNEIDREIGDDGKGLRYILQLLILSDLEQIMPESEFGVKLREIILINTILKDKKVSINEINNLKEQNNVEYEEFLKSAPRELYLEELRNEIVRNARHINIDKLMLICIYRYEDYIENNPDFSPENYTDYQEMVYYMFSKIKNKKIEFEGKMLGNDKEERHVKYTYEDANKFTIRLTEKRYVTKEKVTQYREDLLLGKITIPDIEPEVLQLLNLSNEEYDKVINSSDENAISIIEIAKLSEDAVFSILNEKKNISKELFVYVIEKEKISMKYALELYNNGKVNSDYFMDFYYDKEFLDLIDIKKINDEHMRLKKQHNHNKEEMKLLESKIELYRSVYIMDKSEVEQEEAYNNVMDEITKTFEDENDVLYYYYKGLISFEIVAEWCGEETIERLYNEAKNNIEKEKIKQKLINLSKQGKISKGLAEQIFLTDSITYDELMALILQGAISELKIVDLYLQGKIFDVDFEEMLNNGIISHEEFFTATELRTQEKLEETSAIKLSPILKNIPNKKDLIIDIERENEEDDDWFKQNESNRRKTLIHPAVRYEYLEKLGAKKADVLDIDEDNAFYNYEFFVIPDKNGELNLNSVVIAERFYKDKDAKEEYALDNATYFFQYKDLMVNSNLSKQEMTKEREKIVFRANHRSGSWAIRVLYNIAQTMASSNFKDIKNKDAKAHRALDELDKIYNHDELMSILDLAGEIDDKEKYTYELIDNSSGIKKSNETNDDNDEITM